MRAILSLSHLILLFFTDCSYCKQNDYLFYSYTNDNHSKIMINSSNTMLNPVDAPNWTAQAFYNASMNLTGWDILEVRSNPSMSDEVQAYHAGYIEGYITHEQIWNFYWNTMELITSNKSNPTNIYGNEYFDINNKYIESNVKNSSNDPYWYQVNLVYKQLHGMLDGYNNAITDHKLSKDKMLTFYNLLFMNSMEELRGIAKSYLLRNSTKDNSTNTHNKINSSHGRVKEHNFGDHCSALIKILPGNSDVYIGHDTWTAYSQMNRIIKRYKFPFKISNNSSELISGMNTAFSSYPGMISSMDDFYVIGSGLVTMETTLAVYNNSLYSNVHPEKEVIEVVRSVVANRLAKDGNSWMKYFKIGNSGTYNNQWMIVNLNKFKPGFDPAEGFLIVMEQAPGLMFGEDQTNHMLKHGYWASYNIPFYPNVYKITGNEEKATNNTWFSFSKCPRAKIFKREQSKVVDIKSMISLMRYNKYKTDPYSVCDKCKPKHNACNAISSRCDLNPTNGTYSLGEITPGLFGAIDAKIVSYTLFSKGELLSISGPTTDSVPPFEWSTTKINQTNARHRGQPNLWNFDPIITDWVLPYSTFSDTTNGPTTPKGDTKKKNGHKNGASPTAPLSLFAYLSVATWLIIKSYV